VTLQNKNKLLLLLFLVFLSSCSTTIEQEIFEDGTSILSITSQVEDGVNYCSKFDRNLQLYDKSCSQEGNTISLKGTYYLNQDDLEFKKGLFSSEYTYDTESLYSLLNSLVNLQNPTQVIDKQDELDVKFTLIMPGSVKEHSFSEDENSISFTKSTLDSTRNKKVISKAYHIIPMLISIALIIVIVLSSIILIKKLKNPITSTQTNQPMTQEITLEEQKCRAYLLQFKNQYSKETLFQGLVTSGIPQERAQYYISKYII
jgi:hypothetical protein